MTANNIGLIMQHATYARYLNILQPPRSKQLYLQSPKFHWTHSSRVNTWWNYNRIQKTPIQTQLHHQQTREDLQLTTFRLNNKKPVIIKWTMHHVVKAKPQENSRKKMIPEEFPIFLRSQGSHFQDDRRSDHSSCSINWRRNNVESDMPLTQTIRQVFWQFSAHVGIQSSLHILWWHERNQLHLPWLPSLCSSSSQLQLFSMTTPVTLCHLHFFEYHGFYFYQSY